MMIDWKVAVAAIAAVLANMAQAQHPPIPTFEVAGVHLGDTPASATAALRKAGYRIDVSTTPSFSQGVAQEASRRRGMASRSSSATGVAALVGTGPRLEHIEVAFDQTAAGSFVREVTLTVPGSAITAAMARQQLAAKYGSPDAVRSIGTELSWCSPDVMKVCGALYVDNGPLANQYPILEASLRDGLFLALRQGQIADRRAARDRDAAIEALAPRDKAAF